MLGGYKSAKSSVRSPCGDLGMKDKAMSGIATLLAPPFARFLLSLVLISFTFVPQCSCNHNHNNNGTYHSRHSHIFPHDINVTSTNLFGKYQGKIAFLFLSRNELYHDDIWTIFFSWHAPVSHYNVYWHPSPDYIPPKYSFFANKIIKNRISTKWADWSLINAHRELLKAALNDPQNEYFVLLSESCIPLVPFSQWYRTMMPFKQHSIVHACPQDDAILEREARWKPSLENATKFRPHHWRKSGQWVALNRKHAHLVVYDKDLAPYFHEIKPADEHYVPSLLAMHGLDNETTCTDGLTHVYWESKTAAHPAMYGPEAMGNYEPPFQLSPNETNPTVIAEFMKHRDFISHIRNSAGSSGDHINALCAYQTFPVNRTILPTPKGAMVLFEEAPCHFLGRKFAPHAKYQLLYQSHEIFRDEVFNLSLRHEEVFERTLFRRLRFQPLENNTYLIDGNKLFMVKDTQYLRFPPEKRFSLPPLTDEERSSYTFAGHLTMMGVEPYTKYLYRFAHDATVWMLYNGTRRVIFDYATFVSLGFDMSKVEIIHAPRVKHFLVDPPLKKVK